MAAALIRSDGPELISRAIARNRWGSSADGPPFSMAPKIFRRGVHISTLFCANIREQTLPVVVAVSGMVFPSFGNLPRCRRLSH